MTLRTSVTAIFVYLFSFGCLDTHSSSSVDIVNGEPVTSSSAQEASSTVALVRRLEDKRRTITYCTGVLISPVHVLTAAHCVKGGMFGHETFEVRVTFGIEPDFNKGVPFDYAIPHIDYDPTFAGEDDYGYTDQPPHDIAIIRLAKPAPDNFKPVPMMIAGSRLSTNEPIVLAGFGSITREDRGPGKLRRTETTLGKEIAASKEIGIAHGTKNSCSGDSGGPAYVKRNGALKLLGTLSRGDDNCTVSGIYTDVRHFQAWIAKLKGLNCEPKKGRILTKDAKEGDRYDTIYWRLLKEDCSTYMDQEILPHE